MAELDVERVSFPRGEYHHPPSGLLQLRVVRSGSSYAEIDLGAGLRRVFTRPGDLLLSLPDRATHFRIEDTRELTMIAVVPELASRLLAAAGGALDDLRTIERPLRDPLTAELCRRLEQSHTKVVREWMLGVALAALLSVAQAQRGRERGVLTASGLAAALAAIDDGLDGNPSVEQLAVAAGVKRRAFASAFREATGLPVHQYVLRRRVEHAADLLASTELPLAAIAQRAGFAHQAHMTRVLSRLKGETPGQLRARTR